MSATPDAIEILPGKPSGALSVPSSKSYTNRALLLAALAVGESTIRNPLRSDDAEAMIQALRALGVQIEDAGDHLVVRGTGGFAPPGGPIDCRDSGTTIRFLTAAAALCDFPVTLSGSPQLCGRPLGPLLDALAGLGVVVDASDGCPPVAIHGPVRSTNATIDAAKSSQYASALLMALGAIGQQEASVSVRHLVSRPYVTMTIESMRAFGVDWGERLPGSDVFGPLEPGYYRPIDYRVEFDASSAGHIWAVAAIAGGRVTVSPATRSTGQPDIRLLDTLEAMGCVVTEAGGGVSVERIGALRAPGGVDMSDWPDMLTTLAVIAAFAPGETEITGVAHARGHETDRVTATAHELSKMGVQVEERPDGLLVIGGAPHGARIDSHGDHRMAMAFAAAGSVVPGVIIEGPACVRKTYPGFWNDLRRLGVFSREANP
ncbi:MAG TPA: 3-phosphoshikimate 1-carboxyvinyltransferase [Armatimonadota bacterium]|jgi:3-phosphoshikimate 1-carboxyvinyltransferase